MPGLPAELKIYLGKKIPGWHAWHRYINDIIFLLSLLVEIQWVKNQRCFQSQMRNLLMASHWFLGNLEKCTVWDVSVSNTMTNSYLAATSQNTWQCSKTVLWWEETQVPQSLLKLHLHVNIHWVIAVLLSRTFFLEWPQWANLTGHQWQLRERSHLDLGVCRSAVLQQNLVKELLYCKHLWWQIIIIIWKSFYFNLKQKSVISKTGASRITVRVT